MVAVCTPCCCWWGGGQVGRHPERVENLYFVYLFMMRALNKAADELATYDFSTGKERNSAPSTDDRMAG